MTQPGIYWNGEPASPETLHEIDKLSSAFALDGEISTIRTRAHAFGYGYIILGTQTTPREDLCDISALFDECTLVDLEIYTDAYDAVLSLEYFPQAAEGKKFNLNVDRQSVLQAATVALQASGNLEFSAGLCDTDALIELIEAIQTGKIRDFVAQQNNKQRIDAVFESIRDSVRKKHDIERIEQRRSEPTTHGNLLVIRNELMFLAEGEVDAEIPDALEIELETDESVLLYSKTMEGGIHGNVVDKKQPEEKLPSIEDFELRAFMGEFAPTERNMQIILAALQEVTD